MHVERAAACFVLPKPRRVAANEWRYERRARRFRAQFGLRPRGAPGERPDRPLNLPRCRLAGLACPAPQWRPNLDIWSLYCSFSLDNKKQCENIFCFMLTVLALSINYVGIMPNHENYLNEICFAKFTHNKI